MAQTPNLRRAVPAAIPAAGVLAAAAILLTAAQDTGPSPTNITDIGVVARTPDDPANPQPWTPDAR